ncbi:MAG: hypothetical protein A2284_00640 [Deltaproteobacteria bacterium RIFOXYA12_FULL_61_11]|nr:MAG: hypothetical protein A2284_00640 [Deltaproteobacteria bacterium RIFOXYA12_FULL_61_11]
MVNLTYDRAALTAWFRRWAVQEVSLFGSVLREDFRADSDVDVLVRFLPKAELGLWDLNRMREELKQLFGREVDLLDVKVVERSRNYLRRAAILQASERVYAA